MAFPTLSLGMSHWLPLASIPPSARQSKPGHELARNKPGLLPDRSFERCPCRPPKCGCEGGLTSAQCFAPAPTAEIYGKSAGARTPYPGGIDGLKPASV